MAARGPTRPLLQEIRVIGASNENVSWYSLLLEVAFQTNEGTVHGMAELLSPRCESTSGCLQPFRFIALDDGDHTRLRMALDFLLNPVVLSSNRSPH